MHVLDQRWPTKSRIARRRAEEERADTLFSSARADEVAGLQARSAPAMFRAADLQEDMAEQRFSVPPDPTKTAATQRTSRERSEQSNTAMFAPPICRRRWRNNAFPFHQIRRRRRQPQRTSQRAKRAIEHCERQRAEQFKSVGHATQNPGPPPPPQQATRCQRSNCRARRTDRDRSWCCRLGPMRRTPARSW